ncbi:MAG: sigma-70 family RNA polymerase sigma factor [Verrucomicrobiota bacterium]
MSEDFGRFRTTRWTLFRKVQASPEGEAREALCEIYWRPVYGFFSRAGCQRAEAEDLTQDFFVKFMARGGFQKVDPEKGRFRNYLLTSARRHLLNAKRAEQSKKRGGEVDFVELKESLDASGGPTPEDVFEFNWAEDLVNRAAHRLRDEWGEKLETFEMFAPYLTGHSDAPEMAETAAKLGVTLAAAKSAIHRFRKRFGELVKAEVRGTLTAEGDEEDELDYLLQLLSKGS